MKAEDMCEHLTCYLMRMRERSITQPQKWFGRISLMGVVDLFALPCLCSTCIFDKDHHCLKYVILHSGNMEPFKGEHLKYAMIAVFLLFIII